MVINGFILRCKNTPYRQFDYPIWDKYWTAFRLMATNGIYSVAGLCWLPVVWIQIQLKNMCIQAAKNGGDLPEGYNRLFKTWFLFGWPAYPGLVVVFYLMVAKPI